MDALGFTREWIELGIITAEDLEALGEKYSTSHDTHPEHWRWRAFERFLSNRALLDEATARSLYELGRRDPDRAMGGSMMAALLRRPDCPLELTQLAAQSETAFLKKIAQEQLDKRTLAD